MKKIIFIDNDSQHSRRDYEAELDTLKLHMNFFFGIPEADIENMKIIDGFYHKMEEEGAKDKYMKLIFDSPDIIATYSMYTASHYGSLYTFLFFVAAAGRYYVKGKIYLNVSNEGYMLKALNDAVNNDKRPVDIIRGVNNNHFISYNHELKSLTKAVVDLSQKYDVFKAVPISKEEFAELIK